MYTGNISTVASPMLAESYIYAACFANICLTCLAVFVVCGATRCWRGPPGEAQSASALGVVTKTARVFGSCLLGVALSFVTFLAILVTVVGPDVDALTDSWLASVVRNGPMAVFLLTFNGCWNLSLTLGGLSAAPRSVGGGGGQLFTLFR